MGTALALGLLKRGLPKRSLNVFDASKGAANAFAKATGKQAEKTIDKAVAATENVVVAVKPQDLHDALSSLKGKLVGKLLISIVAGVRIERIQLMSGCKKVARIMPNTPALVDAGASAYCLSNDATAADEREVRAILESVGTVVKVSESLMDAVTGLSGSGPAFVYEFIQGLSDGGVRAGLSRDVATELAARTVLGAAKMVIETQEHPSVLRDRVASPGGTTIHGLSVLEEGAFRGLVAEAVNAAKRRSEELGSR